ncbi:phage tail tip lysozyme [Streptococcus respiraculi]|uniref:phage tail tip lysozyme n=1 Tax=Streptococcus respiraculi TaxID=2021971 RepID=UPI000E745802|nr:phage tail tip lysozyme [Streptococcus respiraculi]
MDEKKTIELEIAKSQLTSPSSERKKTSLSHRNWKRMGTTTKASLLKKVSVDDVKRAVERLRKKNTKQISPYPKLKPPSSKASSKKETAKNNVEPKDEVKKPSPTKKTGLFRSALGQRLRLESSRMTDDLLAQNDDLQEIVELKRQIEERREGLRRVQTSLTYVKSTLATIAKSHSLSTSSRTNKIPKKSPISPSKQKKAQKYSQYARRTWMSSVKSVLSTSVGKRTLFAGGGVLLLFLVIVGVFSQAIPIQSEYDLNETYLYMTQLDRKKSTDTVEYYTNWEDPLLYIHFHYDTIHEDSRLDGNYHFMDQHAGRTYVEDLWKGLNSEPTALKTIKDLYTQKKSKFSLSKDEQEEFEELMEQSKEIGKFASILELENPFYPDDKKEAEEPLTIKKRFGYVQKDKRSDTTTLEIKGHHPLYAPLAGKVTVKDSTITIETLDAKFTFYEVSEIRVKDGQEVETGSQIGKTNGAGGQTISYQKKLSYTPKSTLTNWNPEPREDWFYVNPGFYFKSVKYLEETYLKSINVDSDQAKKIHFIRNYLSKELQKEGKKLSIKGLAGILGNFDIESSITPKRAEGDYLSPPVGASSNSWDDPNWLSMNGPTIYNGQYPNIIHRGLGLGQWTDTGDGSVRHTMLLDYAKSRNKKWYELELQLDFMLHGDTAYHKAVVRDILTSDASTDELTLAFLVKWEGNPGNKLEARRQSARQWEAYLRGGTNTSTGTSSKTVPAEYKDKLPYGLPSDQAVTQGQGYPGNAYALGNCTWYVYNRFYQIGKHIDPYLGNATNWSTSGQLHGYEISTEPKVGSAVVFSAGVLGSHVVYGHVAFCEFVNDDGSFLVSEMNGMGTTYELAWRVLRPQAGIYFMTPK